MNSKFLIFSWALLGIGLVMLIKKAKIVYDILSGNIDDDRIGLIHCKTAKWQDMAWDMAWDMIWQCSKLINEGFQPIVIIAWFACIVFGVGGIYFLRRR